VVFHTKPNSLKNSTIFILWLGNWEVLKENLDHVADVQDLAQNLKYVIS